MSTGRRKPGTKAAGSRERGAVRRSGSSSSLAEGRRRPFDDRSSDHYDLVLYVAGHGARSSRAIRNLRDLLDRHLDGRFSLEVVDIYQQPELTRIHHIVAVPLLVRRAPEPVIRLVGDMTFADRLLLPEDAATFDRAMTGRRP